MAAKVQAQRQHCRNAAIPLAGSDAPIKERSVFYRGVERTKHSEAPVKISQRLEFRKAEGRILLLLCKGNGGQRGVVRHNIYASAEGEKLRTPDFKVPRSGVIHWALASRNHAAGKT